MACSKLVALIVLSAAAIVGAQEIAETEIEMLSLNEFALSLKSGDGAFDRFMGDSANIDNTPDYVPHGGLQGYKGFPAWASDDLRGLDLPATTLSADELDAMPSVTRGALEGGRGPPWEASQDSQSLLGTVCNFEIVDLQGGGSARGDELWKQVASIVRAKKPALFVNMHFDGSARKGRPFAGEANRQRWARKTLAEAWLGLHNMSVMTFAPMEQFGKGFRISTTMEEVAAQLPRTVASISAYNIENEYMWDPNAVALYGEAIKERLPKASLAVDRLFNDTTRFTQVQRELAWRLLGLSPGSPLTPKAMKDAGELMTSKSKGAELLHRTDFVDLTALPGEREALARGYNHSELRCVPSIIGFGPSGIGLPFHVHDEVPFNLQVWGHKRWFISKDTPPRGYNPKKNSHRWLEEEYPKLTEDQRSPEKSGLYECTVRPGEAVYVPRDFYHQTMNVGVQLNVAFACPAANREETVLQKAATSRSRFSAGGKDTIQGDPLGASREELAALWKDAAKYFRLHPSDEGVQREAATVGVAFAHQQLRRVRRAFLELARLGAHDLMDLGLGSVAILDHDPMAELPAYGSGAVLRRAEELADLLEVGFVREERVRASVAWTGQVLSVSRDKQSREGMDTVEKVSSQEEIDALVNGTWTAARSEAQVNAPLSSTDGDRAKPELEGQKEPMAMPLPQDEAEVRARRHLARVIRSVDMPTVRDTVLKSRRLLLKSARSNPINPQAWRNLAHAELMLGNATRAVKAAHRALQLDRTDVTSCNRAVLAMLGPVDASLEPSQVALLPDFGLTGPEEAARRADSEDRPTVGGGRKPNDRGRRSDTAGASPSEHLLRAAEALAHGCVDQAQVVMRQRLAGQIDALWFGQLQRAARLLRFSAARGLSSHEAVTHAFTEAVQRHMDTAGPGRGNASRAMAAKSDAALRPEDRAVAARLRGPPEVVEWGDSLLEHGETDALGQPPQEQGVRTLLELWRQRTSQVGVAKLERLFLRAFEGARETAAERGLRVAGAVPPSSLVPRVRTRPPSGHEVARARRGSRRSELLEMIRSGIDLEKEAEEEGDNYQEALRDGQAALLGARAASDAVGQGSTTGEAKDIHDLTRA